MPVDLSDPDIPAVVSDRLEAFVRARTNGLVRNLRVSRYGSEVVLSGTTHTYYTKQRATHAVYEALDGITLTNNIVVE